MKWLLAVLCLAAGPLAWAQPEIVAKFVPRAHPYPGGTLPYRLFVPDGYDPAQRYPLVLALHGSGERGSDNLVQIQQYRLATSWADPVNQARNPCFVSAPQCPLQASWSVFVPVLMGMIDSLSRQYAIDSNRVYVTGLSMGGYGTWELITRYPGRFAAAVPMSAGWDPGAARVLGSTPVWNFHGALDEAVPVSESRAMINALEDAGREVVYTHSHGADNRQLPDSTLAALVRAHADVLYTEYQFGTHVIWTQAYNHPLLNAWVFDKYRRVPGALGLSGLTGSMPVSGVTQLAWTGGAPADSLELWFSPDAGRRWLPVVASVPNAGSFPWNTTLLPDCGLGVLKAFLKNRDGRIYADDRSGLLAIDNAGNGAPTVRIAKAPVLASPDPVAADSFALRFRAADPEGAPLTVTLGFSIDSGRTFTTFDSLLFQSDTTFRAVTVRLRALPNSPGAVLRVEASDGQRAGDDRTLLFLKQSARTTGPPATPVAGGSGGVVRVNIVDPAALTGARYRVTFGTTGLQKWYDVRNLASGLTVVSGATALDGSSEGPQFDGLRLVVTDRLAAVIDRAATGWTRGSSTQSFAIILPELLLDTGTVRGYPQGSDYQITVAAQVVDTSSADLLGAPPLPMRFSVFNVTEQRKTRVAYLDNDANGALSGQDEVYFLEPDSAGRTRLTWGMTYTAMPGSVPPAPGDQYLIATAKPIRAGDAYEFTAAVTGLSDRTLPDAFRLFQNYPNPFNPSTTIRFALSRAVHTTLTVYTVLGQKVATLLDGVAAPGMHEVVFEGSGLASGLYFLELRAGEAAAVRTMALVR